MSFTLYDRLKEAASSVQTPINWGKLSVAINLLSPEQHRIIYALILHHATLNNIDLSIRPPYGCNVGSSKRAERDLRVDCQALPEELQKIIAAGLT